jgi:hypothetical protein
MAGFDQSLVRLMDLSDMLPQLLIVAGVIALGALIVLWLRVPSNSGVSLTREAALTTSTVRQRREEVLAISAELSDHAQRLIDRIEAHAQRLERLVQTAEERISALDARLRQAHMQQNESPPAASATPRSAAPAVDPLTQSVYELADAGRSTIDIARELQEQIGKVQLILALRQE